MDHSGGTYELAQAYGERISCSFKLRGHNLAHLFEDLLSHRLFAEDDNYWREVRRNSVLVNDSLH